MLTKVCGIAHLGLGLPSVFCSQLMFDPIFCRTIISRLRVDCLTSYDGYSKDFIQPRNQIINARGRILDRLRIRMNDKILHSAFQS
jgi:hypothetical protein